MRLIALCLLCLAAPAAAQQGHAHGERTQSYAALEGDYSRQGGADVLNWDGQGWIGGDIDKFWWKTEGEHADGAFETAEFQALYSRNVWTFFGVQAGLRADLEPDRRAYAVIGVEGLAPYLLETGLHAFIGFKGDVSLRFTQSFDLKITNRFVLEPQLETDLYLADVPERLIGSGFSTIETGVQARYELSRAFAPTLAVVYESRLGKSARLARDAGEDVGGWSVRGGVRLRF